MCPAHRAMPWVCRMQLAAQLDARAVIAAVGTMAEAAHLARFRPQVPLVMITNSMRLYRGLALVHGVAPLLLAPAVLSPRHPLTKHGSGCSRMDWPSQGIGQCCCMLRKPARVSLIRYRSHIYKPNQILSLFPQPVLLIPRSSIQISNHE